jgi:uncharacterized protein YbjQ (UPF0145 family)
LTDARAPQQGDREAGRPHHDLPKDAARPVHRARIRDAMSAARMAPIVSDPWADLKDDAPAAASPWGAARPSTRTVNRESQRETAAGTQPDPGTHRTRQAVIDLTDERLTTMPEETVAVGSSLAPPPERIKRANADDPGTGLAPRAHFGLGATWGSRWASSTQGWVRAESGTVVWRPIVTTTEQLDLWDVDRYLGVVTSEVAATVERIDDRDLGSVLTKAREMGIAGLVTEAVERGAHAVVGVAMSYTPVGSRLLVTMTGTAVTLREKGS